MLEIQYKFFGLVGFFEYEIQYGCHLQRFQIDLLTAISRRW